MRLVRLEEVTRGRVARLGGPAHKSNTLTISRPNRIAIGVDGGSYEIYGFRRRVKDTDEAVIAASGNEDQMRTVGGPLSDLILPANDQLLGLFAAIQRSHPDLPIAYISDNTLRGNFRRVASVHLFWLAAAPGDTPNGLLRSGRIASGIRKLPASILAFAADIDDSVRVGRETQFRDWLAVVFQVRSKPPCAERCPFRDPDVALPFLVECPCDAIGRLGSGQIVREWRAHEFFQSDTLLRASAEHRTCRRNYNHKPFLHLYLRPLSEQTLEINPPVGAQPTAQSKPSAHPAVPKSLGQIPVQEGPHQFDHQSTSAKSDQSPAQNSSYP